MSDSASNNYKLYIDPTKNITAAAALPAARIPTTVASGSYITYDWKWDPFKLPTTTQTVIESTPKAVTYSLPAYSLQTTTIKPAPMSSIFKGHTYRNKETGDIVTVVALRLMHDSTRLVEYQYTCNVNREKTYNNIVNHYDHEPVCNTQENFENTHVRVYEEKIWVDRTRDEGMSSEIAKVGDHWELVRKPVSIKGTKVSDVMHRTGINAFDPEDIKYLSKKAINSLLTNGCTKQADEICALEDNRVLDELEAFKIG